MTMLQYGARFGRWIGGARNGRAAIAQTFAVRVCILLINVVTGVLIARGVGPVGRGELAAITVWPQFVASLLQLGIPSAVVYYLSSNPERADKLVGAAILVTTAMSVVAAIIGDAAVPHLLSHYGPDVLRAAQIQMLATPAQMIPLVYVAALEGRHNFTAANMLRYMQPISVLAILTVLSVIHRFTPYTIALTYFAVAFSLLVFGAALLLRLRSVSFGGIRAAVSMILPYGFRCWGMDIVTTVSSQLDQIVVVGFLRPADMGAYAVALSASRTVSTLQIAVGSVLLPRAAALPRTQALDLAAHAARVALAATAFFAALLCAIMPVAVPVLYSGRFSEAITVAQILTIEAVITGTGDLLGRGFLAIARPGLATSIQVFYFLTTAGCLLVFVPRLGLVGTGIALLVATIVRLVVVLACYRIAVGHRVPSLIISIPEFRALVAPITARLHRK